MKSYLNKSYTSCNHTIIDDVFVCKVLDQLCGT